VLGYSAEALLLAGDWEAAQHELEEALLVANTHEERVYLPQLFLIEAAIAHARGQSEVAYAAIRRAVAEARAQEAPWLELMALLELCERGGATAEDRQALAAVVERVPGDRHDRSGEGENPARRGEARLKRTPRVPARTAPRRPDRPIGVVPIAPAALLGGTCPPRR
jgi:hypothetical protein